jgi:hypothetical protein
LPIVVVEPENELTKAIRRRAEAVLGQSKNIDAVRSFPSGTTSPFCSVFGVPELTCRLSSVKEIEHLSAMSSSIWSVQIFLNKFISTGLNEPRRSVDKHGTPSANQYLGARYMD